MNTAAQSLDHPLKIFGLTTPNPGCFSASGGWSGSSESVLVSVNPTDGTPLGRVLTVNEHDYERVVTDAQTSFATWRQLPAPKRGEIIRQINEQLRANKDALGTLVSLETGKIKSEGDGEVQEMIDIGDFAVGLSRSLYGKIIPSERPQHRMFEQWQPLGSVGIITAFNFPVAVWAWNAFIAAICGDVCIWKPSPKTPLSAIAVQKICEPILKAHGCEGVFQLIVDRGAEDDHKLGQQLVNDPRVPLISFTGSCAVGQQVAAQVAGRMGKSILELGGNNAVIIDQSANLDLAIPSVAFGAVGTAGQRCTSTRRVFIHRSRWDDVTKRLVKAYSQVRIGDPLDRNTLMGPLIDGDSVARFEHAVAQAKEQGGDVLAGGNVLPGDGFFVEPTLVKADNDWPLVQEETFAPILYLIPFDTIDEAIEMQNDVVQGLSSAIFTENLKTAERFLAATGSDCGIANVNIGTSGAEIGGAFGGEKATGGGREAGSDSWRAYMRRQTSTINWSDELPLAQGVQFDVS